MFRISMTEQCRKGYRLNKIRSCQAYQNTFETKTFISITEIEIYCAILPSWVTLLLLLVVLQDLGCASFRLPEYPLT